MSQLHLYNTLTRTKEEFKPLADKDFVGLYSCGPTVYSYPHIGNYKASFVADLIRNTLKILGYKIKSVMNITDVGHLSGDNDGDADHGQDRLEKGAKREGLTAWDVASKYERIFMNDLQSLHIDPFDVMPRATDHVAEQIAIVKELEKKDYTYRIEGDGIYMDTSKIDDYGKLMGPNYKKRLEGLKEGARVELTDRRNPSDFALWKFSPTNEKRDMERDSPRGVGFPGRHIECSAMSSKYLGETFDIHHGGPEHITIHHTNEIAQSECCYGHKPWVKYRMHHGLLTVAGGKMGKSLGNAYTLEDLKAKGFSPLDMRMFYFQAHYRTTQDFTWETLEGARKARENIHSKVQSLMSSGAKSRDLMNSKSQQSITNLATNSTFATACLDALYDDLNTPKLLAAINTQLKNASEDDLFILERLDKNLLKLDLFQPANSPTSEPANIPAEITKLANDRVEAKKQKNRADADRIRFAIEQLGYTVKDTKDGYELTQN